MVILIRKIVQAVEFFKSLLFWDILKNSPGG